jgi:uncharacterized protein YndB with AHSA1/START domain
MGPVDAVSDASRDSSAERSFTVERTMAAAPSALYEAWTTGFGRWFARPDSVLMIPKVGRPFFFETEYEGAVHPHYGRFLRLERDRHVQMTWVTGPGGTKGAETVLTVTLEREGSGTRLTLTHAGFSDDESMQQHESAWPEVLAHQEECIT